MTRRLAVAAFILAGNGVTTAAFAVAGGGEATSAGSAGCPASRVEYPSASTRGLDRVPSVRTTPRREGIVAYLWYYRPDGPWVRQRTPGARIFVNGRGPNRESTKILWMLQGGGPALVVEGRRLGTTQRFRQTFRASSSGYPSTVVVPSRGCWKLSVRSGTRTGSLTVLAVSGAG